MYSFKLHKQASEKKPCQEKCYSYTVIITTTTITVTATMILIIIKIIMTVMMRMIFKKIKQ